MLALLAILGAVGAGLAADAILNTADAAEDDTAEGEDGAEEEALPTEADLQATSLLDWAFEQAAPDPQAPLGQDAGFVDEGMPVSDDVPDTEDEVQVLVGGAADDNLSGGDAGDSLTGAGGNDQLTGRGGDDALFGNAGRDVLDGGGGDDALMGHGGADLLQGGGGNDVLLGGMGHDSLSGSEGDDSLSGGSGADTLMGGEGQDTLSGAMGRDWLQGGAGDDLLTGGASQDTLDGGSGDDTLFGATASGTDAAVDYLNGGTGDDTMVLGTGDIAMGGHGADSFVLGQISDTISVAEIVDYDPAQDELVVLYDPATHADPSLTAEPVAGSDDMTLLLDGVPVAVIRDAIGLDLSQITLRAG